MESVMTTMKGLTESGLRARAKRNGYRVVTSRRRESLGNHGGYMIIDVGMNIPVAGCQYDMDLADVEEWLLKPEGAP